MKIKTTLLIALAILSSCSDREKAANSEAETKDDSFPETLVADYNENSMDLAIEKARSSVKELHSAIAKGDGESHSVKAPISDENGIEHFWLTDIKFKDGKFRGLIGNEPGIVKNVKFGQSWVVEESEISDWMYVKSDMIHGGFTIEALLDSYPKEQADALRSKLVR